MRPLFLFVVLLLVGCGTDPAPEPSAPETSAPEAPVTAASGVTSAAPTSEAPTIEVPADATISPERFTLVQAVRGRVSCALTVESVASGDVETYHADFGVCYDTENELGQRVTLVTQPSKVSADSCGDDPTCSATQTVDLVTAVEFVD